MNPKYLPKTMQGKVGRVLEECGEVIKEIGKIQRFGLDTRFNFGSGQVENSNPSVESNRQALMRELDDLKHAIGEAQVAVRLAPLDYANEFDAAPSPEEIDAATKCPGGVRLTSEPCARCGATADDFCPITDKFDDPDSRLGHGDNACEQDEGA